MSQSSAFHTTPARDASELPYPRQSGIFPNKTYIEIISYVGQRKYLANLALTCRLFASIAVPKMFTWIRVHTTPHNFDSPRVPHSGPKLLDVIRETSDSRALSLLEHVQICVFAPDQDIDHSALRYCEDFLLMLPGINNLSLHGPAPSENLIKNILQLSNLRSLSLGSLTQIRNLSTLKSLRSLSLKSSRVDTGIPKADIIACASALYLEFLELKFEEPHFETPNAETFAIFAASSSNLKEFKVDRWEILGYLATHEVLPPLQKLEVDGPRYDVVMLYQLLCRLPTLTELRILDPTAWYPRGYNPTWKFSPTDIDLPIPLSLSPLPSLRLLVLPHRFAYIFTGPHSLDSLEFIRYTRNRPKLPDLPLELSTNYYLLFDSPCPNLTHLRWLPSAIQRPGETWYGNIRLWIPKLQYLSLVVREYDLKSAKNKELETYFKNFLATWGPLDTLRELWFEFRDIDRDRNLERFQEVEELARRVDVMGYFPNLISMKFTGQA